MSNDATNQVSSPAATVGARSSAYASTWQPCPAVTSASAAKQAIRVRMHDGNGFLTARRPKERSSP
jgi:hypothetical protein